MDIKNINLLELTEQYHNRKRQKTSNNQKHGSKSSINSSDEDINPHDSGTRYHFMPSQQYIDEIELMIGAFTKRIENAIKSSDNIKGKSK